MTRLRVARERADRLEEAIATLLPAEPHLPYANLPAIAARPGALHRLHQQRWRADDDGLGVLVCRDADDRPLAMVRVARREFESAHFGMPMARIELPAAVADETLRLAALRELYGAAEAHVRAEGYRHLSTAASTHDRIACWVLQERGCFHVGTRITWMAPLTGQEQPIDLPSGLRIEHFERASIPSLPPHSWRRLEEWTATAFDRGPFVFDLTVPADRAAAIYRVWTRKALTGEWADVLLVVRDGEEVVAFNAMLLLPDLSDAAGVGVLGRGIGASLPGYRGSFTALQKACAAARPLGAGFLENETQAATVASIKVFGTLGHPCLHSVASFHRRLDDGFELTLARAPR